MELLERTADFPDPLTPYLRVDRSRPRHECWVTGHMVARLDGTAAINGRVGALSTAPDQVLFRRMRQIADVVLVGAETLRREGYSPIQLPDDMQARRRAGSVLESAGRDREQELGPQLVREGLHGGVTGCTHPCPHVCDGGP